MENNERSQDELQWGIIISRKEYNETFEQIGLRYGVAASTASRLYIKYTKTNSINRKKGQGRKPLENKQILIKEIMQNSNQIETCRSIENKLRLENKISKSTIQRTLNDLGYKHGYVRYIPRLTDDHKSQRFEYCSKYYHTSFDNVIFVDEVWIYLEKRKAKMWYLTDNDRTYEDFCQFSNSNKKIMLLGAICKGGKSPLHFFKSTVNSEIYVDAMEPIIRDANDVFGYNNWGLVQDNAKPHTSSYTKIKFTEIGGFTVYSHPPRSPDLNPIEKVWSQLKSKVNKFDCDDISELIEVINESWDMIDQNSIKNTIENLTERMEEVIRLKGSFI